MTHPEQIDLVYSGQVPFLEAGHLAAVSDRLQELGATPHPLTFSELLVRRTEAALAAVAIGIESAGHVLATTRVDRSVLSPSLREMFGRRAAARATEVEMGTHGDISCRGRGRARSTVPVKGSLHVIVARKQGG